ncbi:MAG: hypothetical protein CSA38_04405 [Flavobacteriales bacterium]|nr:MAG: hypothetical protein CSA38_04405 [Flavobacteriales bacterium]
MAKISLLIHIFVKNKRLVKINWKIVVLVVLLIITNLFWIYQVIDTGIGRSYYEVSCEEYRSDAEKLEKICKQFKTKEELFDFTAQYKIEIDTFSKGEALIVRFSSFDVEFENIKNNYDKRNTD